MSLEKAILLDEQAAAGLLGPGYMTHRAILDKEGFTVAVEKIFVPVTDGPFEPTTEIKTIKLRDGNTLEMHVTRARYLTNQEIEQLNQKAIAFEETRLRKIKEKQIELEITKIVPQLQSLYLVLTEEEQAEFASDFDSVSKRLEAGDIKTARTIISIKQPRTNGGLGVQAAILQVLDELLEKVSKLS